MAAFLSVMCPTLCAFLPLPQYVMVHGKFEPPDDLPGRQMVEGKFTLAPLYHVKVNIFTFSFINRPSLDNFPFPPAQLNADLVTTAGVVSGEKVPVITDRNPHLEVRLGGEEQERMSRSEPCRWPPLLLPALL